MCINLDRRPDRWKNVSREFMKNDMYVERWAATDRNDLHPSLADKFTKRVPATDDKLAHVACGLSHQNIFRHAFAQKWDQVAIFEDDVVLSPDFAVIIKAVELQLPINWEFIYLGYRPIQKLQYEQFSSNLTIVDRCYCAFAYIVKRSLFKRLIFHWNPYKKPTDWYYMSKEMADIVRYGTIRGFVPYRTISAISLLM